MEVTIFKHGAKSYVKDFLDIKVVIERIKSGNSKDKILKARNAYNNNNVVLYDEIKKTLPLIYYSVITDGRKKEHVKKHTGLIAVDFDHIESIDKLNEIKDKLINDEYVYFCFISPSGNGLKAVIKTNADLDTHLDSFEALKEHFNSPYFDDKVKNISRGNFESYDPDIYINEKSKVFTKLKFSGGFNAKPREERKVLPVKDDAKKITIINKWFQKRMNLYEGNRNNELFIYACALNKVGVDKNSAFNFCYNLNSGLPDSELHNIINGVYNRYANEFNSLFFDDEDVINDIKYQISKGFTDKEIADIYKELYTKEEIKNAVTNCRDNPGIEIFWTYNSKGSLSLVPHLYDKYLSQKGFYKYKPNINSDYVFIHYVNNIVSEVTVTDIKNFVLNDLKERDLKAYDYMALNVKFFEEKFLTMIETSEVNFIKDGVDYSWLFFKNKALKITSESIQDFDYIDLDAFVWKKHIINFDYEENENKSMFEQFCQNVTTLRNNIDNIDKSIFEHNFKSLKSIIGYLSHSYKELDNNFAVVFNDFNIEVGVANGGSGKGLICQAIGKIKRVITLDGKNIDIGKTFAYQTINLEHQLIVFDDVISSFPFIKLYSVITEGITLEKKNKDALKLDVKESPKVAITTNYTIKSDGSSTDRRKLDFELSDYYNHKHRPIQDFKVPFFDGWDDNEWNMFHNFMIGCIQFYLKNKIVKPKMINFKHKEYINYVGNDFYEWASPENLSIGVRLYKKDKKAEFFSEYTMAYKYYSSIRFTKCCKAYFEFNNIDYIESKDTVGAYFEIKDNNTDIEQEVEDLPF